MFFSFSAWRWYTTAKESLNVSTYTDQNTGAVTV